MKWKRNVKNTWGLLKALINVSKQVNIDRLVTTLRRRRAVLSIFLNFFKLTIESKNIEFCNQFEKYWVVLHPIFTLLRWRHDFLPRFLFIETTETEKKKKKARLFIVGYFEVILCPCQFDNFLFLSLITLITNITFRCNCQQRNILSRVQMKSWAGKALETVNCCDFLKRRLIGPYWQLT
jgi:hypothetical protein